MATESQQRAIISRLERQMAPRQALRLAVLGLEQLAVLESEQNPEKPPPLFYELMAARQVLASLLNK